MVDGLQLDGGDAKPNQVLDHGGRAHGRVGAALVLGDVGVAHGEAAYVRLVDHGVGPGHARLAVVAPGEAVVDHHRPRHVRGGVALVGHQVVAADAVAEDHVVPVDHPLDRPRIRVEQQLGGIATQAAPRLVGAVDPVAVALLRPHLGHVAVPGVRGHLGQLQPPLGAVLAEQAQLDRVGLLGEDGEVGALTVPGRSQGSWPARPDRLDRGAHVVAIRFVMRRVCRTAGGKGNRQKIRPANS